MAEGCGWFWDVVVFLSHGPSELSALAGLRGENIGLAREGICRSRCKVHMVGAGWQAGRGRVQSVKPGGGSKWGKSTRI